MRFPSRAEGRTIENLFSVMTVATELGIWFLPPGAA